MRTPFLCPVTSHVHSRGTREHGQCARAREMSTVGMWWERTCPCPWDMSATSQRRCSCRLERCIWVTQMICRGLLQYFVSRQTRRSMETEQILFFCRIFFSCETPRGGKDPAIARYLSGRYLPSIEGDACTRTPEIPVCTCACAQADDLRRSWAAKSGRLALAEWSFVTGVWTNGRNQLCTLTATAVSGFLCNCHGLINAQGIF